MADFGNPLVLSGNYELLSIQIFFAVVGAAHDQGRAAVLAIVLLASRWGRSTRSSAGSAGWSTPPSRARATPASRCRCRRPSAGRCYALALPWGILALVIYAVIIVGGFVRAIGRGTTRRPSSTS